jgi:hypothetical protein
MPKFVIERNIPGVGKMSQAELRAVSDKSNSVLKSLGPNVQWVHSYVSDDKIYCVYNALNMDLIREHAKCMGIPADKISQVRTIIDPTTAE